MKIPADPIARQQFYGEILRACLVSRQTRFVFYKQLRNFFLFGSADGSAVPYNKIKATVEQLQSFICSVPKHNDVTALTLVRAN